MKLSYRTHEKLLKALAIALILSPAFNFLYSANASNMGYLQYWQVSLKNSYILDILAIYLLAPIAGIAILMQRPNTYYIALGAICLMWLRNFHEFSYLSYRYSWALILGVSIVNLVILAYVLSPKVMALFFHSFDEIKKQLLSLPSLKNLDILDIRDRAILVRGKVPRNEGEKIHFQLKDYGFADDIISIEEEGQNQWLHFQNDLLPKSPWKKWFTKEL
tara:strand:- start:7127 stop:7783 length:657 start_codon:yes stop_codon:yes gene_type:complete